MKFMLHLTPVVPATPEERERLAPIAHRTDKTQEMLEEMVDLAQFAEEAAFDALSYSEHHFYTEGLEAGATPIPHMLNLTHHTKRIQVGPVGFVLPTWDPIRLAEDIAWVDHMSKGRIFVGLARGFFPRWVNVLGQKYSVEPGTSGPDAELRNREVFQELFEVMKLSWRDEPFSFNGKYYQVPFPAGGHDWPAHEATRRYGAPGEVDTKGWLHKISPVPKPYQKPHPPLFQALTTNEETIRWTAREGIVPMMFLPFPDLAIQGAATYTEAANAAGHDIQLGQNVGLARLLYVAKTREEALRRAHDGAIFLFSRFHAKFAQEIPSTIEPFIEAGIAFVGTVDDIRRQLEAVKEKLNPDWFMILSDQGFLPRDEMKEQLDILGTKIIPEFAH